MKKGSHCNGGDWLVEHLVADFLVTKLRGEHMESCSCLRQGAANARE